jgi:hypothetical protein
VDELHELKSFDNTITSAKQFGMVHLNASATNYLLRREVQKLVEVNTTVRELAEGSALLGSLFLVSLLTEERLGMGKNKRLNDKISSMVVCDELKVDSFESNTL